MLYLNSQFSFMKYIPGNFPLFILLLLTANTCLGQNAAGRPDKFYTMSGAGFSFPVGESSNFMRPKFSTTLGANLGLGNGRLFLYPKISLHVFGYDKIAIDDIYNYAVFRGRSTTYLLNVALGYRKIVHKFAFYGFAGAGGGFILTPRVTVDAVNKITTLNNRTNHVGIVEPGIGIEYNIGGANLFIESSFMHGFGKIQDKSFNAIPLTIGIKPNLSKLFR